MDSQSNQTITLTKYGLAILAIVLFGIFLRVFNLDFMAFHHDESIHAYYSWKVYKGDLASYSYNPVYHGPFLYHFGALHFLLFGDSDFSARLPFAFAGILMLYFVWRLRPWIGTSGVFFVMLFVALSPVLTYFSRFARNDIYMGTAAMGIIVFALEYLRSKKTSDLVWMSFFLVLMYTIKENSYMYGFFFGSFMVFYGIYHIFSYPSEMRPRAVNDVFADRLPFTKILTLYGLYSVFAFTYVYYGTHTPDFKQKLTEVRPPGKDLEIQFLHQAWSHFVETHSSALYIWLFALLALVVLSFWGFTFIQKRFGRALEENAAWFQQMARHNLPVLLSLLVILIVYSVLFTTLGANDRGMHDGVIDYLIYWMGQQGDPRIPGPPTYYLPRLSIYETLPIIVSILAFFVYTFHGLRLFNFVLFLIAFAASVYAFGAVAWYHVDNTMGVVLIWFIAICVVIGLFLLKHILYNLLPLLRNIEDTANQALTSKSYQPDGFRIFLIYWSIFSILIYGMLEEKVPWLLVHQALPLCLLAGVFLGDTWKQVRFNFGKYALIFIVALFAVYAARTSIVLNFYNADDPRELMVYTQTGHMTNMVVDEIEEAAERLGSDYMPPNPRKQIAALQGEASWPYSWYFRNYLTAYVGDLNGSMPPKDIPFLIAQVDQRDRLELWAKGDYTVRRYNHQVWWPYGQSELPFTYFKTQGRKVSDALDALMRYILHRDMWGNLQPGSKQFDLYRRTPLIKPLEKPEAPPGFEQPPRPLVVLDQAGSLGTGPGQFNKPRGVAVSPDGSKIYVLDGVNCRIQVFDQNLDHLQTIGGPGEGPGEFSLSNYEGPNGGISVAPDGKIYATDTWYRNFGRINVYDPDGKPLEPILRAGVQQFFAPRGLHAAPNNRLYVSDTGNHQVIWFDETGNFGGTVAKAAVREPVGVTMGPAGLLYICDVENKRVVSFTQTGQMVKQYQIIGWKAEVPGAVNWIEPYVALDRQGNIYVTDSTTNSVYRFNRNGNNVTVGGGRAFANGGMNAPKGIAVDAQNNIYIADSNNHRILKVKFP